MSDEPLNLNTVNASPTKRFFIDMLIKDIDLLDAITDLIDNSVDGAKSLRGKDGKFDGLTIKLTVNSEQFKIQDNCGGITSAHARNYAFRFGRPEDAPPVRNSVGQFGVGMKRSLFKLGSVFRIHSMAEHSEFTLDVEVEKWKEKVEWQFEFTEVKENLPSAEPEKLGTEIEVSHLHSEIAARMGLKNFETDLILSIESRHTVTMQQGLVIMVNGRSLNSHIIKLLFSKDITPAYRHFSWFDDNPILVRIYCGLFDDKKPAASGWHIFCNGRLIVEADNTTQTGWGEEGVHETKIPRWHPQYGQFRGYVFLDCEDASRMPWNTTKSGIDFDSSVFQRIKLEMVEMMRPVVDFINKLKDERKDNKEDRSRGPLSKVLRDAKPTELSALKPSRGFEYSAAEVTARLPKMINIQYSAKEEHVELVKEQLGVKSAREAGVGTFNYYYKQECQ